MKTFRRIIGSRHVGSALAALAAAHVLSLTAKAAVPVIEVRETVAGQPLHDAAQQPDFPIRVRVQHGASQPAAAWLRVTDSFGLSATASLTLAAGAGIAHYPRDFAGAGPLAPGVYFIDAAPAANTPAQERAEAVKIVYRSTGVRRLPELPTPFTTDLLGADGKADTAAPEWPRTRALVNLYFQSRGAALARVGRPGFDLERPADLEHFKDGVALYEFDARDRDWSTPLGRRVARSFWQAVWDRWFGPTNDHARPGNPPVYPAYTFTNDTSDILVANLTRFQLQHRFHGLFEDNLATLCGEVLQNLSSMQRQAGDPIPPQPGVEGEGAFYYGLFWDGEPMLDGMGWFHGPGRRDHRRGGVFIGRAVWALGEALASPPLEIGDAPLQATLRRTLRWTFGEARRFTDEKQPYVRRLDRPGDGTGQRLLWRTAGEHAYLMLGLVAACGHPQTAQLPVFAAGEYEFATAQTVQSLTWMGLDALADSVLPDGYWSRFADVDATAIAALARGAMQFPQHPSAPRWRAVAVDVAEGWLDARPRAEEYHRDFVLLSGRRVPGAPEVLSYRQGDKPRTHLTYFHTGLWLQALTELHALTRDPRYRARFDEQAGYLCGNNPFQTRLLTELGGVYNYVYDTDGDTIEDRLSFDLYPESTAFVQIGVLRELTRRAGLSFFAP